MDGMLLIWPLLGMRGNSMNSPKENSMFPRPAESISRDARPNMLSKMVHQLFFMLTEVPLDQDAAINNWM